VQVTGSNPGGATFSTRIVLEFSPSYCRALECTAKHLQLKANLGSSHSLEFAAVLSRKQTTDKCPTYISRLYFAIFDFPRPVRSLNIVIGTIAYILLIVCYALAGS